MDSQAPLEHSQAPLQAKRRRLARHWFGARKSSSDERLSIYDGLGILRATDETIVEPVIRRGVPVAAFLKILRNLVEEESACLVAGECIMILLSAIILFRE